MNPPRAELRIIVTQEGKVEVTGPLDDKMTCYALLELARDVVKDHVDARARSPIVPAHADFSMASR
jgi:putative aminopeptidase FrvX